MDTNDFYYELPQRLIAQTPLANRDGSRLLVYDKSNDTISHKHFFDIQNYLQKGDVLVVNNTRVLPARLFGTKSSGANVQLLLHKRISNDDWECLCKPARRLQQGSVIDFGELLKGTIIGVSHDGSRIVRFEYNGIWEEVLDKVGTMPLPHYIKQSLQDKDRYQTVYAERGESCAAPTAGLHFTSEQLESIKKLGVAVVPINLNVGLGTFRPVKTLDLTEHTMHSERYTIPQSTANIVNEAKKDGRRIIAVGTTSVRAIESATDKDGTVLAKTDSTNIFIYPPYKFKTINGLITNFHLPKSTLIMLVSAFIGREITLKLYSIAVENEYRFFSFGDAMFVF